ncbi:trem-like transcript 4 protein [Myotis daubentonii]|uniref:trem-like transcript 4 protein n=1 Tax=Myotis daubentonii TaxID=98922 RepID=UPI0028739196|nr:trem-like transcript 4 protein [Myotis daubentonii]
MAWEAPYLLPLVLLVLLASVNQPRLDEEPENPRYFIRDYPGQGYFTVNMTALAEQDSGLYWCGLHESSRINILRTVSLAVSQGESFPLWVLLRVPEPQEADAGKDLMRSPSPHG